MAVARTTTFGPLVIRYDDRVLAPRPWTILQSEWALELLGSLPPGPVLELCAGTGHIGLVVAYETGRELIQVEADAAASQFALENARLAPVHRYHLRHSEILDAISRTDRFPLILADPPYVPSADVRDFPDDPPAAIDGGADGLDLVRQCLEVARRTLLPDGALLLQVRGKEQGRQIGHLVEAENSGLFVDEIRVWDEDRAVALLTRDGD